MRASPGKSARDGLAELGARSVKRRLNRSFFELQRSSSLLAEGHLGVETDGARWLLRPRFADGMEEAEHLLANQDYDLAETRRDILLLQDRIESSNDAIGAETYRPTEIEELLQSFHDRTCWKKLIYSSWDRAETDVQTMHQRWADEDWANARQQFIESLGQRTQKWNPAMDVGGGGGGVGGGGGGDGGGLPAGAMFIAGGGGGNNAVNAQKKFFGVRMSIMAEKHARVIREANVARERGPTSLARDLTTVISDAINERWRTQQDSLEDDMNQQELICYKDVVKMMSEIVGESMDRARCPEAGAFSSICFHESQVGPSTRRLMRARLTSGAKKHLEKQKYDEWNAEIDEAVMQGRLRVSEADFSESRQQSIRSYVGFSFHLGSFVIPQDAAFSPKSAKISDALEVRVPVWALLFHYLRVGELEGAINEIERCRQRGLIIDDATLVCLHCMKSLAEPDSQPLSPLERQALYDAMYRCHVLFEEEFNKPCIDPCAPRSRDPYKALVLNLLSIGAEEDAMSDLLEVVLGSNFQIEDYLWGSLWFVTWSNVAQLEDHVAQGAMVHGLANLRSKGEENLYNQIAAMGGADYFNESNCFVYCKVLLCCQKYGEAILHLWKQRKALAAVHLTVVCLHYGLILPHRPLTYSPTSAAAIVAPLRPPLGAMSDPSAAALLRVYNAPPFLLDYPEEAVDYLLALDSKWQVGIQGLSEALLASERLHFEATKTSEFTTLLTSVGRAQLTKLVGSLEPIVGAGGGLGRGGQFVGRGHGYLDRYLPREDVHFLLAKAAHYLLTQTRDSQGAVHAFQLAGRFEDAIEEMVNQVGQVLVPPAGAAVSAVALREQWVHQCKTFNDTVLGGRMHLAPLLQRLNTGSRPNRLETLAATLEVMLGLCSFVDAYCQTRYRDALSVLDAMDLRFDDRLLRAFGDMHRTAQHSFDYVLIKAMDSIKQLFFEARRTGDREWEESEMRQRAGDISRFANAISQLLQPATAATLNRTQVGLL